MMPKPHSASMLRSCSVGQNCPRRRKACLCAACTGIFSADTSILNFTISEKTCLKCSMAQWLFNPNMSNCFGLTYRNLPFWQQKVNALKTRRDSKMMARGAFTWRDTSGFQCSFRELSALVCKQQRSTKMMLKEIESWFPTHADDMPWTSGPKSERFLLHEVST